MRLSKRTNHLLRLGATPVTCVGDVLAVLASAAPSGRARRQPLDGRLEQVRAVLADAPASVDEIVAAHRPRRGAGRGGVAELELLGVIVQAEGGTGR